MTLHWSPPYPINESKRDMRQNATVKLWNRDRGFGFLRTGTGEEYFVHCSALELARDYLEPREQVTFIPDTARDGRTHATDVRLVQAEADQAIGWIEP